MDVEDLIVLILFIVFAVAHLIGEMIIYAGKEKAGRIIRYVTKPFLMPLVAIYYILAAPFICGFILSGIIFGFVGDILLMLSSPEKRKVAFTIGLIAYPISHIAYTVGFIFNFVSQGTSYNFLYWTLALSIPMIILGIFASIKILPMAEKMKIPMLVNIVILVIMGIASTLLFYATNFVFRGTIILVVGVFIYMFSVLIYAWHNYVSSVSFERLIKMSTYLLGLFLVIQGFIWAIV